MGEVVCELVSGGAGVSVRAQNSRLDVDSSLVQMNLEGVDTV